MLRSVPIPLLMNIKLQHKGIKENPKHPLQGNTKRLLSALEIGARIFSRHITILSRTLTLNNSHASPRAGDSRNWNCQEWIWEGQSPWLHGMNWEGIFHQPVAMGGGGKRAPRCPSLSLPVNQWLTSAPFCASVTSQDAPEGDLI